ncbi:MAG TPA: beta-galactosidase GalA [Armatimonadota bacterium]|jgi:beta-galactosidase
MADCTAASPRTQLLLDPQWRFHRDDLTSAGPQGHGATYGMVKSGGAQGPAGLEFDDSDWRLLDLPHDFVVEGTHDPRENCDHGFLPGAVGWYRKTFFVPAEDLGRRSAVVFEGVFRNATVWCNGHLLGTHASGYIGFRYDITDILEYGGNNVLAVRVDATGYEGWWYEGGGIYRHVWLEQTHPVRVAPEGVFVTSLLPSYDRADLRVATDFLNDGDQDYRCLLTSVVLDADGTEVARAEDDGFVMREGGLALRQELELAAPQLWSPEHPYLYRVVTTAVYEGCLLDQVETTFGVRRLDWDADQGFFLNGQPYKLQGTCNHQDHAGVGIAVPDRVQEYRIERLKEMGGNAYRCAHNPPAPALLDACDRLGMLVMDENRYLDSTGERREDLKSLIRRDRNHPSVFMWSLFNEESLQGTERGARIYASMKAVVRDLDPTRPVTGALSGGWEGPVSPLLDVEGYNYSPQRYDEYHQAHPTHPMVGSECCSTLGARGVYRNDEQAGYLSAYDVNATAWGNLAQDGWRAIAERPFMSGIFIWTGFDYRGEPQPFEWPCINSHFGILDTCGFAKDNFYYYRAWWQNEPVLHLLPHWNWPERLGEEIPVWVHSNLERVELFLNGTSLGAQEVQPNRHLEWQVPYTPGRLEAVGYRAGAEVLRTVVETTGPAATIQLTPRRPELLADGEDVAVVTVSVHDAEGRLVPLADDLIRFEVTPHARIIGVGNGDPASHEPDQATQRRVFHGLAQVLVQVGREPGEVVLTARAEGLLPTRLAIPAQAAPVRPRLGSVTLAQRLATWRVSPVLTQEPPGDLAPAVDDQNSWEPYVVSPTFTNFFTNGDGWIAFHTRATAPAYDPATERLTLRLTDPVGEVTKVYIDSALRQTHANPGMACLVPLDALTPGEEFAVLIAIQSHDSWGGIIGPITIDRLPR